MPPTADEIKARLEKAVDKEGNVLNMGAVHDIVTWLEQVNITQEALEATRVGLALNLMRKKIQNEALAKRAKNLIKKWQVSVMNQHPKTNLNGVVNNNETNSRPSSRTGSKELHSKSNETALKAAGVKRKRMNGENSPMPLNTSRTSSPYLKTQQVSSPRVRPQQTSSPRVKPQQTSSPRAKPQQTSSPRLKPQKISSPRAKPSSPHVNRLTHKASSRSSSPLITTFQKNEKLPNHHDRGSSSPKINNSRNTVLNNKKQTINDNHTEIPSKCAEKDTLQTPFVVKKRIEDGAHNIRSSPKLQKTEGFTADTPSDTRVQENRISSCTSGLKGTCDKTTTNSLDLDDRVFEPIVTLVDTAPTSSSQTESSENDPRPESFEPIEEEELSVSRRELPTDLISPDVPADGVNGVFNENDEFRNWTDEVVWRDKDYHILPYVILD